jgi:hypothetical protein
MRVLRTETYFDGNFVKRREDKWLKSSNICFAWIETGANSPARSTELTDFERARQITPDEVPLVLDYILRRERMQPFADRNEGVINTSIVEQILHEPIVIEQSPVDLETLSDILKSGVKGSGTVALSVYLAVSGDVYLFITLPMALLVVGASKGMSKWLEQNVPKLMTRATKRWIGR